MSAQQTRPVHADDLRGDIDALSSGLASGRIDPLADVQDEFAEGGVPVPLIEYCLDNMLDEAAVLLARHGAPFPPGAVESLARSGGGQRADRERLTVLFDVAAARVHAGGSNPLDVRVTNDGERLVHLLAERGDHRSLARAIEGKADANATDIDLWRPAHYGACAGHVRVLEVLRKAGADLYARNSLGETPLRLADIRRNDNKQAAVFLASTAMQDGVPKSEWRAGPPQNATLPTHSFGRSIDLDDIVCRLLAVFPLWRKAALMRDNGIPTVFFTNTTVREMPKGPQPERERPDPYALFRALLDRLRPLEESPPGRKTPGLRRRIAEHLDRSAATGTHESDLPLLRDMMWASAAEDCQEALACLRHLVQDGNADGIRVLAALFPDLKDLRGLADSGLGGESPLDMGLSLGNWSVIDALLKAGFRLTPERPEPDGWVREPGERFGIKDAPRGRQAS